MDLEKLFGRSGVKKDAFNMRCKGIYCVSRSCKTRLETKPAL